MFQLRIKKGSVSSNQFYMKRRMIKLVPQALSTISPVQLGKKVGQIATRGFFSEIVF